MGIQKDKLSEDQKKEIERLRSFVSRNRLNAQMNGTKWRAAIDAIQAISGYRASFRVKRLTEAGDPPANGWDENFPGNIPLYNAIEWLELKPWVETPSASGQKSRRINFAEQIKRELEALRIPLVESSSGIRILGYTRSEKK